MFRGVLGVHLVVLYIYNGCTQVYVRLYRCIKGVYRVHKRCDGFALRSSPHVPPKDPSILTTPPKEHPGKGRRSAGRTAACPPDTYGYPFGFPPDDR